MSKYQEFFYFLTSIYSLVLLFITEKSFLLITKIIITYLNFIIS